MSKPLNVLIAAFYTNDFYRNQASRLATSLDRLKISSYTLEKVLGCSTWNEAVSRKPAWIGEMLNHLDGYDGLFYTDADSEFIRMPDWEVMRGCDFAAVEWKRYPTSEPELLTGSCYFANNDRVRGFVDEWSKLTPKYKHTFTPEQRSLAEYFSKPNPIAFKRLPVEWCFIHDDHRSMYPDAKEIILHHQASREYKQIEAKEAAKAKRAL